MLSLLLSEEVSAENKVVYIRDFSLLYTQNEVRYQITHSL